MAKLYTTKDIRKRVNNLYNNEYDLIGEYTKINEPITLLHKPCGNIYTIARAKDFLNENKCKCKLCNTTEVHSTKKLTEEDVIRRIYEQTKGEYIYIDGFINSNTKMNIKHKKCGNIFQSSPHMFLGTKQTRCPYCSNKNRGKYALKENYLEEILIITKEENNYKWLENYKDNNKLKHKIKHLLCGNIYEVRPNDFQRGYRCPLCSINNERFKEENNVYEFIKNHYNGKIIQNYRNKYEIDIYLPKLKKGFEFNGSYWHSTKIIKDKNYHINKKNYFKEKGIDVYFIDEIDWKNKNKLIKNKILYILNLSNKEKIFARNTAIKFNIDKDKKKKFLEKNHIQGNCNDNFNIALIYNKKIVALMTFGFNRINVNNKNKKMELLRYATNNKYSVVGGFSKLLKHSIEYIKENYKEFNYIITYADLSWSNGNLYYLNDFKLDHISKPSYFFVYNNKKINRFSFRKTELKKKFPNYYKDDLTEQEITDKIPNLLKIYNCGNLVFIKEIK